MERPDMKMFSPPRPGVGQAGSTLKIFIPFALGYFLSYLFRVVNAVIAPDLVADLGIDPSELGLLTSTYFIAFASSQIPLGVLLDRFGPRMVESFLLLFAGTGAIIFAVSDSLTGVIIGRAFIGFGVSACLMAAFKSYVLWFPARTLSRINGFQMAAGGLGALAATTPVEWALHFINWRGLFWALALLSFAIALAVFLTVPEQEEKKQPEKLSSQLTGVILVFKNPFFRRIAPLTALSQSGYIAFQGLWAGPWLKDVALVPRAQIAVILSWSALAMIAGFITLGFLAEKLAKRGVTVLTTAVSGMGLFILVQAMITFAVPLPPTIILVLFGFFGTSGILSYTALTLEFPKSLSGRVTTSINMMVFIAAFCVQWAIGAIINCWEITSGNYNPAGYRAGFMAILGCQLLALAWFWIAGLKKTP